jgi:mannitol/fructose-specific phosphotransferase system IIA component (Ntr-type)/CBS domain-containing protein
MNIASLFDLDIIDVDIKAETKSDAMRELASLFCRKFPDKDKQAILDAVMEREELGSTSFGRGFAFPHARTDIVHDLHIAIGVVKNGVKDAGPDNIPIKVICLLLTPRNISKLYLQTLSGLANLARRPGMLDRIVSADSPQELIAIINGAGVDIKRALTVADIMSDKVVTVKPDDSLKTVVNIMYKYNFDGIPVIDDSGKLLGEVSGKELIKSALPGYEKLIADRPELEPFEELLRHKDNICVKDVMRKDIPTVSETALAVEVAAMMFSRNADRIMVIRDDKLIGIVAAFDIISKIIRG